MCTQTPQSHDITRPSCSASRTTPSSVSGAICAAKASPLFEYWGSALSSIVTNFSPPYLCSLNCRENRHHERARRPIYSYLHAWGSAPEPHRSAAPSRPIERRHPKSRSQVAETRSPGKDLLHIFLYVHLTWHPDRAVGACGRCRSPSLFLDFIYYTSVGARLLVLNYRFGLVSNDRFFEWFP